MSQGNIKTKLTVLGALCAAGAWAPAHAANVELYGLIDASVVYSNNQGGAANTQVSSGTMSGSRFGLRGNEDLGGGLKALFVLENGFSVNNGQLGQNSRMFGRAAYVGLQGNWGRATIGRQNELSGEMLGALVAANQWAGGLGAHPGDVDNNYVNFRISNAVKYTSPTYRGLTFSSLYSFGGVAGSTSSNRVWSVGTSYQNGPVQLAAAYTNANSPNTSLYDGTNGGSPASPNTTPLFKGYTSANTYQTAGVGGAYTFGALTVGLVYNNTQFRRLGSGGATAPVTAYLGKTATFNSVEANARYALTPSLTLGSAFTYTRTSGAGDARYEQLTLGADYNLSKRTDVYLVTSAQHASGTDSTGKQATAAIWALTASSTSNQWVTAVGVRHKF